MKIKKIVFETIGNSSEPYFSLVIYCDRISVLNAVDNNFKLADNTASVIGYGKDENGIDVRSTEIKGIHITKIKKKNYNKLKAMIANLDNEFKIGHFDSNTIHNSIAQFKVIYQSGETKAIYDNGMTSNEKLKQLYNFYKNLRFNQKWK